MVDLYQPVIFESVGSVVIAEFDRDGTLLNGNAGLHRLTTEYPVSLWQLLTQPQPGTVMHAPPDSNGRIYSGLLTVVGRNGAMITLTGAIYCEADRIQLVAGYDMSEVEALSSSLLELNGELTDAYRELAQSNRALELREVEIRRLALTDVLTGVGNRRRLDEALVSEIARSVRSGQMLSLVILDIDYFKKVNDTWGHMAGDRVLQETGAVLLALLRPFDVVTRMGGEEFVVFLPTTTLQDAMDCAERLRLGIEGRDFGLSSQITASFGVSCLMPGETGASLLARADTALYDAKQAGRNRVMAASAVAPG